MIRTLPILLGAILLSAPSIAQVTEAFENDLSALSANCWQFDNIKYTKKGETPDYVINGKGSIYSNPPVNNTSYRTLASPFLDVSSTIAVSFAYKLSSPLGNGASRHIKIGLENKYGFFTLLDSIDVDGSAVATQNYNTSKASAPGIYRLVIKMGGKQGDGNCRIVMDDLVIGANYHYANHCNSAPIAHDDSYTALKGNVYQGSTVLANDQDPDGEGMTAALVTNSADGEVKLNADGSFSFTPNPLFKGETTSFTYKLTDDGYTPASSGIATVTLKFEEAAPLVHLIDFAGKMNREKVQLRWEVGFNEMLDHFELEKSINGTDFSLAKLTKASSKAGVEKYEVSDAATASKLLYRLKLVSTNGNAEYSQTISLNAQEAGNQQALSVVQNPVTSDLVLNYNSDAPGTVMISVTSTSGVAVYSGKYAASAGTNRYQVASVSQLKAGTYIVTITNEKGEKYSSLFVKI